MHYNQRIIGFFFIIVLLLSCKNETATHIKAIEQDSLIHIPLEIDTLNTPFLRATMAMTHARRAELNFQGIPELDTISIQKLIFVSNDQIQKWRDLGYLSTPQSNKLIQYGLYAVSGLSGDQHIIIPDVNSNGDFADDQIVSFDRAQTKKYQTDFEARDSLKSYLFEYTGFLEGQRISVPVYLKVLPFNSYSGDNSNNAIDLSLTAEEKQFYQGFFTVNGKDHKIALDDGLFGAKILVETVNNDYKTPKDADYLSYKLKDTINLVDNFYTIDSISPYFKSLVLRRLNIQEKTFGYRKGDHIKPFFIQPIDRQKQISILDLLKQKPFLLIDFWGTWCAPCTKLTPDLIALNNKFKNGLNTVSIAVEPNIDNVKSYVTKKQLNWYHHHIPLNPKNANEASQLIDDLFIQSYPTFILLNNTGKIIYRGTGNSMDSLNFILGDQLKSSRKH
jgi:thiol-disulfide isomerase/thioredoxin